MGLEAARKKQIQTTDLNQLVQLGFAQVEGLRYEDFLPISAAGIFASNLGQYGTQSTAASKPTYTQKTLEQIMGRKIIDPNLTYAGVQAESLIKLYSDMGLSEKIASEVRMEWERSVTKCHER